MTRSDLELTDQNKFTEYTTQNPIDDRNTFETQLELNSMTLYSFDSEIQLLPDLISRNHARHNMPAQL